MIGEDGSEGISKQDGEKRTRLWEETKEKLKNPNFVVNPLRLSIKNIPAGMDDAQLRALCVAGAQGYLKQHGGSGTASEVDAANSRFDATSVHVWSPVARMRWCSFRLGCLFVM